jgi:hypothetical protein
LFPSFTLKLMLLFIIMNMSNYRVYIMRENASAPGGIVFAPAKYAVMQGRSSVPIATRQRLLEGVRVHHVPSAPIMYRPRHVVCSPRPLPPVRAHSRFVRAQWRSVLAQSHSVHAYKNKSTPAGCGRRMPGSSIKGRVPQ